MEYPYQKKMPKKQIKNKNLKKFFSVLVGACFLSSSFFQTMPIAQATSSTTDLSSLYSGNLGAVLAGTMGGVPIGTGVTYMPIITGDLKATAYCMANPTAPVVGDTLTAICMVTPTGKNVKVSPMKYQIRTAELTSTSSQQMVFQFTLAEKECSKDDKSSGSSNSDTCTKKTGSAYISVNVTPSESSSSLGNSDGTDNTISYTCASGTYNSETGRCETTTESCPSGTIDGGDGTCYVVSQECSSGMEYDDISGTCKSIASSCKTGYRYNSSTGTCQISGSTCQDTDTCDVCVGTDCSSSDNNNGGNTWIDDYNKNNSTTTPDNGECLGSTVLGSDGLCHPQTDTTCSDGTTLGSDGLCHNSSDTCDSGYVLGDDGLCRYPISSDCPTNTHLENGTCVYDSSSSSDDLDSKINDAVNNLLNDSDSSYNAPSTDWWNTDGDSSGSSDLDDYFGSSDDDSSTNLPDGVTSDDGNNYYYDNGVDGSYGANGYDGEDGYNGDSGEDGVNGTKGENGLDGSSGTLGSLLEKYQNGASSLDDLINGDNNSLLGALDGSKNDSLAKKIQELLGMSTDSGNASPTKSNNELFDVAKQLLMANGMSLNDIINGKSYDSNSAYTEPKIAWDLNRITTLLKNRKLKVDSSSSANITTNDSKKTSSEKSKNKTQNASLTK